MYPVVVLTGGRGTRIAHLTGPELPKALLPVAGWTFIDFKLEELAAAGFHELILLVGHGGEQIRDHVGDGSQFDLAIECIDEGPDLLGTGGAIVAALPRLGPWFWVTYGDTLLEDAGVAPAIEASFDRSRLLGVMTVIENVDRWEPSNVDAENGLVTAYAKGDPPGTHRFLDYGLLLLGRDAFDGIDQAAFDLGLVIAALVERRQLGAATVKAPFHDIGTEERWRDTDAYLRATRSSR